MKGRFFDPSVVARAYRDPLSRVSLAVNLLPVIAVFAFGWGAAPLVAIHWLENPVIGAFTVFRMLGTAFADAANLFAAISLALFFTVRYGMFCFAHGVFLAAFSGLNDFPSPQGLFRWAPGTAPEMGAPYGRVITLHVAIVIGAAITIGLGQPLLAVLLLIVIRAVFGNALTVLRRRRRDAVPGSPGAPA